MQVSVLKLLNKVYQSIYCYALYFEEQKQENIAKTFFANAKSLENIMNTLEKQNKQKAKYIVYPIRYYDNDRCEKLEDSFIFDTKKAAKEFLSLVQDQYTTLEEVDYVKDGWSWEMREILIDNSIERIEKLAKYKKMNKTEVNLERELNQIEEFFDFLVLDYDRGADYDENFLEYIKKDIEAGMWEHYTEREIWKKYDILKIFKYIINENDGYMIKKEELEKYRKEKE